MKMITEMGLQDYQIRQIIKGYRIMAKIDEITCGEINGPILPLVSFIENMLPAFARTFVDGAYTAEHEELREIVLSEKSDDEVIPILLAAEQPDQFIGWKRKESS